MSRLSILAPAVACVLAACERKEPAPAPEPSKPPAAAVAIPPAPPPALGRADLLRAMDAAASAYAAGGARGEDIVGRRFAVRQAFGCFGPTPSEAVPDGRARWAWDRVRKAIELRLSPADWKEAALIGMGGESWEAAEGFWLTRPWLRAEDCPAPTGAEGAPPVAASAETMGVAAVFEKGGSRLGRRNGRAYAFTVRGPGDEPPPLPVGGYRLVLEGRFVAFSDGGAIRCRAAGPDQRPVCVAAAQLDRVAFEDAGGTMLSEWRPG